MKGVRDAMGTMAAATVLCASGIATLTAAMVIMTTLAAAGVAFDMSDRITGRGGRR